jgi:two-component system sensor histidine kinase ChiS
VNTTAGLRLSVLVIILSCGNALAQGLIRDLTQFDFDQSGLCPLSGRWQFYWNRILTPTDSVHIHNTAEWIEVPGGWNQNLNHPALGYGTYRMVVMLPAHSNSLVIYFPIINSSGKIWVNGKVVAESGNTSLDPQLYKSNLNGTIVELPLNETRVEIMVNVVNYTFFNGGFSGSPQIGKMSHLVSRLSQRQGVENFFAGSLIAMFIYQLILYVLFKGGKPYIWLALICLGVALRAMIVHGGSLLLPNLFPSMSWEFWKKIEFGSVYAITAFFPLYIFTLFKNHAPRWPIKFFVLAAIALVVAVLVTPQFTYGQLLPVSNILTLVAFVYAVYSVRKAWKSGDAEAKIIFFGVLASFPFIVTEISKNTILAPLKIEFLYLVDVGVLIFLLFQVYLLARHYAISFRKIEIMNQTLESVVTERTDQLSQANRVKDRLLSVVTHDIKAPMNSLRGILNIYNSGSIDAEEFKQFSKLIENDLNKTSLLVDNILFWTVNQLKGAQIHVEQFDLKLKVAETIELFNSISSSKRLNIKNEILKNHSIYFDQNVFTLVFRNLISNAIKFSHPGQEIIVQCEQAQEYILVKVIDFGVGMSQVAMDALQNFGATKSQSGTDNEQGHGLGLSLCREYLKMAGGGLGIASKLGKGSTLTMSIPTKYSES